MEMISQELILRILGNEMPYLRKHFGVERIALFGSYARGNARDLSDVDLLITLSYPLGFSFIQLAEYLEAKLGRKVDLVTDSTLERNAADPRRAHIASEIQETLVYV